MASIECKKNGPYIVRDVKKIIDSDGLEMSFKPERALCRCGKSGYKPFCDGTDITVGFDDQNPATNEAAKPEETIGEQITVYFDEVLCSHSQQCSKSLPETFKRDGEMVITPDASSAESIIKAINNCPSGALSYSSTSFESEAPERQPEVTVLQNGPYQVKGGIELKGVEKRERASDEHYCLCRCGESSHKPFCDGTHKKIGFRDDGFRAIGRIEEITQELTRVTIDKRELVIVKRNDTISVFSGLCLHMDAKMSEGFIDGNFLTCGKHLWRYDLETGKLDGEPRMGLKKLIPTIEDGVILVSATELETIEPPEDDE